MGWKTQMRPGVTGAEGRPRGPRVLEKHLERAREGAASSYLSMAWETARVPGQHARCVGRGGAGPQRLPVPLP
jgi:hypothetical protein